MKEYYNDNKEKLREYKKEKLRCANCGCTYTRVNKSQHEKKIGGATQKSIYSPTFANLFLNEL